MIMYTKEMKKYFQKRTEEHIDRVKKNLREIYLTHPNLLDDSVIRHKINTHDESKFSSIEKPGYILITEKHRPGSRFRMTDEHQKEMDIAWDHHKKVNPHHPEFHKSPDDMSNEDIAEMVADWAAMSQEKKDNLMEWTNKAVNERFKFKDNDKIKLIYKFVNVFPELSDR